MGLCFGREGFERDEKEQGRTAWHYGVFYLIWVLACGAWRCMKHTLQASLATMAKLQGYFR